MLVAGCEPLAALCTSTTSSSRHQDFPFSRDEHPPPPSPPSQNLLDLALEGRSILLQQRVPSQPGAPHLHPHPARSPTHVETKIFSPLQLRIDLHSEQGVDVPGRVHAVRTSSQSDAPSAPLDRRQRAQLRRRQEQQKPADQVVYQRRTPTRPRTPAACPRTPLAMSTMSMPAAGQKFATDDTSVFGSAEEASACVKRLLAKTGTSVVEEHRVTSSTKSSTTAAIDYLQDSFDFLHQRHMKNLSDVIARHQRQQQPAAGQEEQVQAGLSQLSQQRHKKQVHIHQSAFYDGLGQNGLSDATNDMQQNTFKSTKTINLSNNNSTSSNSSVDLDDAKMLQQTQQRRCARENSTSSLQSQSSVSSARSESFDNCNNNFCDAVSSVSNKSNTSKISSKSSTSSSSTSSMSSSTTRMQQSFSSSKKVVKQSFSSSSQDFEDRMGIDVMLTPFLGAAPGTPTSPSTAVSTVALPEVASASTKKVKQTTKVSSSSSVISSSSDHPDQVECKQSSKVFKAKTVKKSVSDGRQVHTDVDKYSETAEEEAEGSPDKPVITFSHVSSEGSHQAFTDNIVRFDSSTLSSPSRSRSPSPLLEMPAPYSDLAKEIKRPPMEKA